MFSQEPDPDTAVGRMALRARRVPVLLRVLLALPAVALFVLFIATDSGPYGFFAGLQASVMDGEHYLIVSGGLSFIVVMLPSVITIQLLGGLYFKEKAAPPLIGPYGLQHGYPQHQAWQSPQAGAGPYPQPGPHGQPVQYTPPGQSPQPGQSPPPGWQSLQAGPGPYPKNGA